MHVISSYRGNRPTNTPTNTPKDKTDYNTLRCSLARISSICPQVPLQWIVTKFGMLGRPAVLINCA